jgi:23S rRNA pseudouridine1911/1915/1917 synthase
MIHNTPPDILFEDNHLIAVNKRAGDLVQADKSGDKTIVDWLKELIKVRDNKPGEVFMGVIHRLDRPVSGVVLFAKTSKSLSRMNEQFREKETGKTYWAVTANKPEPAEGTIKTWLIKDEKTNTSRVIQQERPGAKWAVTDYSLIGSSDKYHLLQVVIHSGRHHQIRVHLSSVGCPIKGDLKYGSPRSNPDGGIHLHSRSLKFKHPVQKEWVEIIAPVPKDVLWQAIQCQ